MDIKAYIKSKIKEINKEIDELNKRDEELDTELYLELQDEGKIKDITPRHIEEAREHHYHGSEGLGPEAPELIMLNNCWVKLNIYEEILDLIKKEDK